MNKSKRILLFGLSSLSLLLTIATVGVSKKENRVAFAYPSGDAATYYNSITATDGLELLSQLQTLQNQKLKSRVGYKSMPGKFSQTDPGTGGKVMAFYDGGSYSYSGNMNREHVWPASRTIGGRDNDPLEDDIHMVRPTLTDDNSGRGNAFFVEGKNIKDRSWDPANCGNASYRGDSARIILYCVVADSRLSLTELDSDYSSNHNMGKLSDLLKWNLQYPVQQREKTRNEAAESLQGNRNPFIDHPEYACRIWGNRNEATKAICGGGDVDPINSITLSETELEMKAGTNIQLTVTIDPSSMQDKTTLYWGSDNSNIASVSSTGLVSAKHNGTCTITVLTEDGVHAATCTVKVTGGSNPTPSNSGGCGGNVATTSIVLSTIALLGIGILLIKKVRINEKED